jgi:hypothetical protein
LVLHSWAKLEKKRRVDKRFAISRHAIFLNNYKYFAAEVIIKKIVMLTAISSITF